MFGVISSCFCLFYLLDTLILFICAQNLKCFPIRISQLIAKAKGIVTSGGKPVDMEEKEINKHLALYMFDELCVKVADKKKKY